MIRARLPPPLPPIVALYIQSGCGDSYGFIPPLSRGCGGGKAFITLRGVAVVVVMASSMPCGVAVVSVMVASMVVVKVMVMLSSPLVVWLWWW